jgi:Replication-relaxation
MRPLDRSPLGGPLASSSNAGDTALGAASGPVGDATHPPQETVPPPQPRLSRRGLVQLADQLSDRDQVVVETLARLRLLQADQVRRLFFHDISTKAGSARVCRRSLQQLTERGLLRPLERQVGGRRAGSKGTVYATTAASRRLVAYWSGLGDASNRGVHEPGAPFLKHTLAISDLYVTLVEADRAGTLELFAFDAEPACWRTFTTPLGGNSILKPDALVRVAVGEYEHASFVEVDLGTEGRGALLRKTGAYIAYFVSGREQARHGLFPRVVWITTTESRARALHTLIASLPAGARRLFVTTVIGAEAIGTLTGTSPGAREGGP